MEIKYEAVFGDQSLFDNEFEPNAIAVIFIDRTNKFHATSETEIDRQLQRTGSYVVAMRRVIKTPVQHSDDTAVDLFAAKMKEKLKKSRDKGRSGWESCLIEHLIASLKDHISKGDPVDVANFAMMISQRGESIKTPAWTMEDKQAGRLPKIGCLAEHVKSHYKVEILAIRNGYLVVLLCGSETQEPVVVPIDAFLQYYQPIETPAEKAQRLREEWAEKASKFIDDELDCVNIVGEHVMRRFYNAMLAGELKAPEVE